MRLHLIANPVSGGDARKRIARAVAWFQAQGAHVDVQLTERRGDAMRFASQSRKQQIERIVVAGGDGTLSEVINGLVPSSIPVAFLPLGTVNVFALEAGIPGDIEQACQVALHGTPRQVCLGTANGTRFLLMASAGFDAAAVHFVDVARKRRIGKLAYLTSALGILCAEPLRTFEVVGDDGFVRNACQAVVGNGRLYGGRFSLTPSASLFAERLDVCLVRPMTKVRFIATAVALMVGLTPRGVERFSTCSVALRGTAVPVQIDGDPHGTLPQMLSISRGEVTLVFPNS